MHLLTRNIAFVFNELLVVRNRIPGFLYISPINFCCPFDESNDLKSIKYEPGYAHIRMSNLHINSPVLNKDKFDICERTSTKLQSNFDKFGILYDADISFVRLKPGKANKLAYPDTSTCFIFSKDFSEMLCVEIDRWIYPIITNFVSLNGKPSQKLIIGWNLSILESREEDEKQIITMDKIKPITLGLLCKKDVDVRMVDSNILHLQISRDSVQHFREHMDPLAERETDEQKKSRLRQGRKLRAVYYLGCFLVCLLFLFSILKTTSASIRREA